MQWDKLAHKMKGQFCTSKHPVFHCSNMRQTGALMKRKEEELELQFENESDNHRMLVVVWRM